MRLSPCTVLRCFITLYLPSGRVGLALASAVATALPYAVGILKNGLVELVLLAPIVWLLAASQTRGHAANCVLLLASLCLFMTAFDLILRPLLGARLHYSPMNQHQRRLPTLPILGRWDPLVNFFRVGLWRLGRHDGRSIASRAA